MRNPIFHGLTILAGAIALQVLSVDAAAPRPSVLILGRTFFSGIANIDEQFKEHLNQQGYEVGLGLYQETDWEDLRRFNLVICLAQPLPRDEDAMRAFIEHNIPDLQRFIDQGGGVLIMHGVTTGGANEERAMNTLLEPLDGRILDERLHDTDEENVYQWTYQNKALRAQVSDQPHPILQGVNELWFPRHKHAIKVGADWDVLATGQPTARSHPRTRRSDAGTYDTEPPIIAARTWGQGRVVLYPSPSTYTVLEGYHPRWRGYIFEAGDGLRFFDQMFDWLTAPSLAAGNLGGFVEADQDDIFPLERLMEFRAVREVPARDQGRYGSPQKVLIGVEANVDNVATWADMARAHGYAAIMLAADTFKEYQALETVADEVSDERLQVLVSMNIEDRFQNRGLIFGGALSTLGWPLEDREPRFTDQAVRMMGLAAWTHADENPRQPRTIGSIAAMEVKGYEAGALVRDAEDRHHYYNRYDWYLAPLVINRLTDPAQLEDFTGYDFYVMAQSPQHVTHAVAVKDEPGSHARFQPLSQVLFPCFISSGPLVEAFHWEGRGLSFDRWEGEYYQWFNSDDVANIHIRVSAPAGLTEVRLFEDDRLLRRYPASGETFETVYRKPADNSSSNYRIEVEDADGGRAVSSVLRSRSAFLWAHGGADRMNTYANLFYPDERGDRMMGDMRLAATFCLPEFDLGWGTRIAAKRPPLPHHLTAARGIESASLRGGLARLITPPFLAFAVEYEGGRGGIHAADIKRAGYELASRDAAILEDQGLKTITFLDEEENEYLKPPQVLDLHTRYTQFRALPMRFSTTLMESELTYATDALESIQDIPFFRLPYTRAAANFLTTHIVQSAGGEAVIQEHDFTARGVLAEFPLQGPGFVGLYNNPEGGNAALYVLDDHAYTVQIEGRTPAISLQLVKPADAPEAGTLQTRLLWVYTTGQEPDGGQGFQEIFRAYGLDGGAPQWDLDVVGGMVVHEGYPTVLQPDAYGLDVRLTNVDIPGVAAFQIKDINPNWSAGVWYPTRDIVDMLEVEGHNLFVVLPRPQDELVPITEAHIYAGNLVIADHPDIRIDLLPPSEESTWTALVHNPREEPVAVDVTSPLIPDRSWTLELSAGEEKPIELH